MQRILLVDDDPEVLNDVESGLLGALADLDLEISRSASFAEAEQRLVSEDFDLVVLDVMDGDSAQGDLTRGRDLYLRIHETRWIPVVFYSGVAQAEEDLARPPLVAAVKKGDTRRLYDAARAALASNAASSARTVTQGVDRFTRRFFRDHVAAHWADYELLSNEELQRVLTSRLAAWMREWKLGDVDPGTTGLIPIGHEADPSGYYLFPPVARHGYRAGSVLSRNGEWSVVLTPTCDLFEDGAGRAPKAEFALVGRALPAEEVLKSQKNPKEIISGHVNRSRWYFLPAFLTIPDLVLDLEQVESIRVNELSAYDRVADLDSPFAEHLVSRNSQWRGRVGKPDLDVAKASARLLTR